MSVLLLRLAGPMQSWGSHSRFTERDTGREPTKSGVVGLLCAALGKPRDELPGDGFPPLTEFATLRMGVRVDREGVVRRDFHTAGGGTWMGEPYGVAKASGAAPDTLISNRYYLADAAFVVGLDGPTALLQRLDTALGNPVWPVFLGRKSFVASIPIPAGVHESSLEQVLFQAPLIGLENRRREAAIERVRFVIECTLKDEGEIRQDNPRSFALGARSHGIRKVQEFFKERSELFKEDADVPKPN